MPATRRRATCRCRSSSRIAWSSARRSCAATANSPGCGPMRSRRSPFATRTAGRRRSTPCCSDRKSTRLNSSHRCTPAAADTCAPSLHDALPICLMFGYACDETPSYMPLPIFLSHRLVERQAELRRNGKLPWLRPDAKSQVTIRYANGRPESLDTVVLSTQHAPGIEHKKLSEAVIEEVIKPVLPKNLIQGKVNYTVDQTAALDSGRP